MPVAADDTRHFETAVELSPEDTKSNLDYFREQGLQADYDGDPPAEQPKPEAPAVQSPPKPEEDRTADDPDPEPEPGDAASIDGEKQRLGWRAKKTQQIRELEAKLAEQNGANEELRRQLAGRDKPQPADGSTSLSPAPAAETPKAQPKAEPKAAEPPKAKEFDKPKPVRPKFEDFASADDPIAAHADAVAEYADRVSDWKDEKREFEAGQKEAAKRETADRERQANTQREIEQEIGQKLQAARSAHPDFDQVTSNKFTPVLSYVLREAIPDGFEIGYELAKPENAAVLASLRKSTQHTEGESQRSIERRIAQAIYDVAQFNGESKARAALSARKPAEEDEPAPQTPSPSASLKTAQPRREEASPAPVRSRGAAAEKLEDIPVEDYDRRKAFRKAHGLP
jgi:hypothetical protein